MYCAAQAIYNKKYFKQLCPPPKKKSIYTKCCCRIRYITLGIKKKMKDQFNDRI